MTYPAPYQSFLARYDQTRRARAMTTLEHETMMRIAAVRAEAAVTSEKVAEVGGIGRTAMVALRATEDAADILAGGDIVRRDAYRRVEQAVAWGTGELLAGLIQTYAREL